jgi:hypothetical protein
MQRSWVRKRRKRLYLDDRSAGSILAAMHVWGVTIQGLLSNYIYDGSPRNVRKIIIKNFPQKNILKENNITFLCEQELALAEGALPQHLLTALYTQSADGRFLTNRQLSRHLVGLWTTDSPQTLQLLRRILPAGLLDFLDSEEEVPRDDIDRLNVRDNLKGLRHEIEN